jgi:hypothetical protein
VQLFERCTYQARVAETNQRGDHVAKVHRPQGRNERRELVDQHNALVKDLPGLENREKGEALRRIFKTVTLYWDREFIPKSDKPSRPIKTNRPGRNRFSLIKNKIGWEFSSFNLDGSP